MSDTATLAVPPESVRRPAHPDLILCICCMSLLLVGMDVTIVNVALPSIGKDFRAKMAGLQWVFDAYTLVVASFLMLAGATGDRVGRRRTFQAGMALFTFGSLLCSVAPNLGCLIAFRAVQALGASMLNPVAISIIANVFTEPAARARAFGVWGTVAGLSLAVGPVVGGFLVEHVGWRSVFWVNLPIGAAALVLTARYVTESKAARPRAIDAVGQTMVFVALATLTSAVIEVPHMGWSSPTIVGLFAAAAAAVVAFVLYEPRRVEPLLDLRFFSSVPFSSATVIAVCAFLAFAGFLFLNTLYLQDARGLSPLHAGLYTLPIAGAMLVASPLSGRIVANRGTRLPLVIGSLALIASALMLTTVTASTSDLVLFVAYLLFGLGSGLVNPPITNTAVTGMPPSQAGVAAAVASTSRQIGATLGVAVLGALAGGDMIKQLGPSFATATHTSWWVVVGIGCVMLVGAFVTTTPWALQTATNTAERLRERDRLAIADGQATESEPASAVV
jgi:EmrB/QacA subfamily drug resistance transporter